MVADGVEECCAAAVTNGKKGYLVVKLYKALYYNLTASGATALLGNLSRCIGIGRSLANALTMT